jgi:hypothetical protein
MGSRDETQHRGQAKPTGPGLSPEGMISHFVISSGD